MAVAVAVRRAGRSEGQFLLDYGGPAGGRLRSPGAAIRRGRVTAALLITRLVCRQPSRAEQGRTEPPSRRAARRGPGEQPRERRRTAPAYKDIRPLLWPCLT